jgi:hypothetical protein
MLSIPAVPAWQTSSTEPGKRDGASLHGDPLQLITTVAGATALQLFTAMALPTRCVIYTLQGEITRHRGADGDGFV